MKKTVVVTTTIRVPHFLKDVCENAVKHNKSNVSFIVIADNKTPLEARDYCKKLEEDYGFPVAYYDLKEQEERIKDYPTLIKMMPYDSGSRKLVGNFIAHLEGFETLIMLDDDNIVSDHDYFGNNSIVGEEVEINLFESESGWYNVYENIIEENKLPIYPRGYPWSYRFKKDNITQTKAKIKVASLNSIVLEDPDIDAISRLYWPIRVVGMKEEVEPNFALNPGTWSSFNNQATAISQEVIPVFFTPPATGRNADIWTSYVICCLASHMNQAVAYGHPLVRQFRNPHNLWVDLEDERINDKATDNFVEILRSVELTQDNYLGALDELLAGAKAKLEQASGIPEDERDMIHGFLTEYKIWCDLFVNVEAKA